MYIIYILFLSLSTFKEFYGRIFWTPYVSFRLKSTFIIVNMDERTKEIIRGAITTIVKCVNVRKNEHRIPPTDEQRRSLTNLRSLLNEERDRQIRFGSRKTRRRSKRTRRSKSKTRRRTQKSKKRRPRRPRRPSGRLE